jgi:hypothetical protein
MDILGRPSTRQIKTPWASLRVGLGHASGQGVVDNVAKY